MRWKNRRKSRNVVDRRGLRGRGAKVGGGLGAIVLVVIYLFFGGDSDEISRNVQSFQQNETSQARTLSTEEKKIGRLYLSGPGRY